MILITVEEPFFDTPGGCVTRLAEQRLRGFIVCIDIDIKLMEMENTNGVVAYLLERSFGISLPAAFVKDDDTELGAAVSRVEVDEVDDADGLSCLVDNHHPHLTVGIDIVGSMGHIVVEHITGIRHIRCADVPKANVVLDAV